MSSTQIDECTCIIRSIWIKNLLEYQMTLNQDDKLALHYMYAIDRSVSNVNEPR